jgi:hypothetical protein
MKKILFFLFVILMCIPVSAQVMILHFNDHSADSIALSEFVKMYFSDPNAQITRLSAPRNVSVNIDTQPMFQWQDITDKEFEFLLTSHSDFRDTIMYADHLDTNVYQISAALDQNSTYYWKVRIQGQALWTAAWSFTTYAPPSPKKIKSWAIQGNNAGIQLMVNDEMIVDSFMVLLSLDGRTFQDTMYSDSSYIVFDALPESAYFIKVAGVNTSGISPLSEMLFTTINNDAETILLVQGFERQTTANNGDLILRHAEAMVQLGVPVASITNDALYSNFRVLPDWKTIDYILGEESTADETFSTAEQNAIKDFLRAGGNLLVSGAEIACDLDYKGTTADKAFCHDFLHLAYYQDAPGGQSGVAYNVRAVGDTIFSSLAPFAFDNGTHGSYNVMYPDVFTPQNDARTFLEYTGYTGGAAGIVYEGMFPEGRMPGKVMVLGFPFETIYPEASRIALMEKFYEFVYNGLAIDDESIVPETSCLDQNYPNPFNPITTIAYQISEFCTVELSIYDMNGKKVKTLIEQEQGSGHYSVVWDASHLASGIYFTVLKVNAEVLATRKMTLLK